MKIASSKFDFTLILSCEHAGNRVPASYFSWFAHHPSVLHTHRGWDPGAFAIGKRVAKSLGQAFYFTDVSRLLVDCNRSIDNPSLFSPFVRGMSEPERKKVLDRYYFPHRDRVEAAIQAALAHDKAVLHIAVHSFTPVLAGKRRTASIGLLYDPAHGSESAIAGRLRRSLQGALPRNIIRMNYPYKGTDVGFQTYLRERCGTRYNGLEIEFNNRLTKLPTSNARLADALTDALRNLSQPSIPAEWSSSLVRSSNG